VAPLPGPGVVDLAARGLRGGGPAVLLLGGTGLSERGLRAASRIAAATGVRLIAETHPARLEGGAGVPAVRRLAYFPEQADRQLAGLAHLVLAGARSPVSFFAYPGRPTGDLVPDGTAVTELAGPGQDVAGALEELAAALGAPAEPVIPQPEPQPAGSGPLTVQNLGVTIAASLPEHAIVVDEANTSAAGLPRALASAPRHTLLALTGGAIGYGLPAATGAAVAAPDRPVVCIEADGSALYTIQALWTQAREQLNVTTVLVNNAAYAILRVELQRTAAGPAGPRASALLDLSNPTPDFTEISRGMGVPAVRVTTAEELDAALRRAHAEPGPHLIEAIVPPVA
jgi:acetolactate synthase-1/2/3 large subunit